MYRDKIVTHANKTELLKLIISDADLSSASEGYKLFAKFIDLPYSI